MEYSISKPMLLGSAGRGRLRKRAERDVGEVEWEVGRYLEEGGPRLGGRWEERRKFGIKLLLSSIVFLQHHYYCTYDYALTLCAEERKPSTRQQLN